VQCTERVGDVDVGADKTQDDQATYTGSIRTDGRSITDASILRGCLVLEVKNFGVSDRMFHGMSEGMFGY
jgi:hypothetical protein